MRLKALACEVLARPLYLCAARSPHIVDIELVAKAQHEKPLGLRALLQERIDAVSGWNGETPQRGVSTEYDAIVLGYGLCGQATAGLVARRIPLVIPRAHDCITLFLGDRQRYSDQFTNNPGTYWYAQDYIERQDSSGSSLSMGAGFADEVQAEYETYVAKYGKENADYLMEVMGGWQKHYQRAAYIDMGVGDGAAVEAKAQAEAVRRGWAFEKLAGDLTLIRRLIEGDWETDFLVVQPGQQVKMTYDEGVIGCV